MGLFDRLKTSRHPWTPDISGESVTVLSGRQSLEVVGEAAYQDALWRVCNSRVGDDVRSDIVAVLVPEPANPYDANAIAVMIDDNVVAYFSRDMAQKYLPGLKRLMSVHRSYVALRGVVVGGGYYDDGPGRLGIWLDHNPADFGVQSVGQHRRER